MLQILIAPNSFKNSLTAEEVADAIEAGLQESKLPAQIRKFPIADGGDHTSYLLTKYLEGEMKKKQVQGAYLQPTEAQYGFIADLKTAIIEVAETSGFKSIQGAIQSPINSSSYGLGELILHNIEAGVQDFIICLGGSATVDGGIGLLQALGVQFKGKDGQTLQASPANFKEVDSLDASAFKTRIQDCRFTILCDVENKLLGEAGAAAVFGPQKGASEADVELLEDFLNHFTKLSQEALGEDLNAIIGGGAAGGLGACFAVWFKAKMEKGTAYFCKITGFEAALAKTDLLITGEGSIDSQSLEGKAPLVVASYAKDKGIPTIGLAGKIPQHISLKLQAYFSMLLAIGSQPENLTAALLHTKVNLSRTAKQIGLLLARTNGQKKSAD